MAARYVNDIEISKAQRDFELKKAAFDQEVQTKKAQSEMAYSLQVIRPDAPVSDGLFAAGTTTCCAR